MTKFPTELPLPFRLNPKTGEEMTPLRILEGNGMRRAGRSHGFKKVK